MNLLVRLAFAMLFGIGLWGCSDEWTWKQKLTVSVQTPEGIKTASGVMRASLRQKGKWFGTPEARGALSRISGEAVVLELAPGKYLFALIKDMPRAYRVMFPNEAQLDTAKKLNASLHRRTLSPDQYPLLVTFDNVSKPASVKPVDPADLVKNFGPGYKLISISMEITDEAVSHGQVAKLLPWLPDYYDKHLDGQRFENLYATNRFANSLAAGAFDTERP